VKLQRYDVFLSYSRSDADRVRPLVEELRRLGYKVFFDVESIGVGERWKNRLESSIRASRVLVLCWSAQAKGSEYVQFEYSKAEGLGRPVTPWLLDDTPLPAMVEIQAVTVKEPPAVAEALATRIGLTLTRRRWLAAGAGGAIGAAALAYWLRPQGYEFEGEVTGSDSLPLAGVDVAAETASVKTDALGKFRLRLQGSQPEWVRLQFSKDGYQKESRNCSSPKSIHL
jgi:TIR domain